MSDLKICLQCGTEYEPEQRFCPRDGATLRLQNETGDLVGAIIADRYHVTRKLGEGGMGQVYLAEHVKMGRKAALKVLNPSMVRDADAISRFNREAANASQINHPHVASVYDFGETPEGMIYLAMEFVDGPSLTTLLEGGALPPLRAAAIVRQASEALAVAHDMGIVHRDLKPDNIMIARDRDGCDCVKVVDFGIAKAADSEAQKVTKTGLVVGTPEYMSPEQLAGDRLDGRSDIYALALVAFTMLTGVLPFPAETAQESMIMRLTDRPRTLGEMRPDVTWAPEVQKVLDRALARDLSARYQSAAEFGGDLHRAIERMVGGTGGRPPMGAAPAAMSAPLPLTASAAPGVGGGQLAASVPATRVGAGAGGVAADDPRPGAADRSALIGARATSSRSKPLFVAAAALALIVSGGATLFKMLSASPGRTLPREAAAPATPADTGRPSASLGGGGAATDPSSTDATAIGIDRALQAIASREVLQNDDAAGARRALATLDSLKPLPMTRAQLVRSTLLRAEAQATLGNTANVCAMVKGVREPARDTPYAQQVERFVTLAGC